MVNTEKPTHSFTSPIFLNFLVVMLLLAIAPAVISNSLTKPVTQDEQMYCTAAVLISQGQNIYADFPYVAQLPYHPMLCAAVFKLANTSHYLLTTRMLSCLTDMATIIMLMLIIKRIFENQPIAYPLAIAGTLLYLFNQSVDHIIGLAWNHIIVTFASLAAIYFFITLNKTKNLIIPKIALIAALLTFAAFTRPTTALVFPVFLILVSRKAQLKNKLYTPVVFIAASILTAAAPLYVIAKAPQAFLLNAFKIPALNAQFLQSQDITLSKITLTLNAVFTVNSFLIIAVSVYLFAVIIIYRQHKNIKLNDNFLLILLVTIAFVIITYIPPTCRTQYFAIPVPFMIILMFASLKAITNVKGRQHFAIACILIVTSVIASIFSYPQVLGKTEHFRYGPSLLEPFRINNIANEIAEAVNNDQPILTLTPLYALEADLPIYNQFAAGIFTYRIAHLLTPEQRETAKIISPEELNVLLGDTPPAAVIIGSESKEFEYLENSLVTGDIKNWPTKTLKNNIIVFIDPQD